MHRCLQETESQAAKKANVISEEHAEAVTLHQNHSSIISRKHYQKTLMHDASRKAIEAHGLMYGTLSTTLRNCPVGDDMMPYEPPMNVSRPTN